MNGSNISNINVSALLSNENSTASNLSETKATIIKATFGFIAILSFVGNLFLCIVMVRKRSMLKKAYNVLIFNLAVADMLTG